MHKRISNLLVQGFSLYIGLIAVSFASEQELKPSREHVLATRLITQFIEQFHYKSKELDDSQSMSILTQYYKSLDPNRSFFTQEDIETFNTYEKRLDDALLRGDVEPAFKIFRTFNDRRIERAEYALKLLDKKFDFNLNENFVFDRTELPWAKDLQELDEIWRKRVKNDVLTLRLTKKSDKELKKTLTKRYQRIITQANQIKSEDTYEIFINTYLATLDPHTSYFSPRTSENFKINMSLSLEGIGAALRTVDEYTVVQRIITGGPADLSGLLHEDDKIIGVAQGKKGEMEDVIGWRIDDVVDLIRGPKDSVVRLQVLEKGGVDGPVKEILLVRNKVKLEEQQAKKAIIEIPDGDKKQRIGVITLPMFYMDFEAYSRGDKDFRSTTRDTKELIDQLVAESVDGIVIDLRGNGGGSLSEAVSLTGLFIKTGPIVQVREKSGKLELNNDTDPEIAYSGPLAVLVNRFSASASEIFAGAIQDYGRGIILGEPTFGKGTVQSVVDLNRYVSNPNVDLGKLKLTIAQFFRVNGDSTQHRGVVPDIVFPTAGGGDDQGERSLDNALPWANIVAAKFTPFSGDKNSLSEIEKRHQQRVQADEGFEFLVAQAKDRRDTMSKKEVTLLLNQRKTEREAQEDTRNKRLNKFRLSRGMKPVDNEEANSSDDEDDKPDEKLTEAVEKIELQEAANILIDYMGLAKKHIKQAQRQASHKL